ncbi:MAG: hypothetical protein GX557_13030 [Chloroflexi bacterium]|nr:hypothetical protein [Chloroflexota bacterium]
MTTTKPLTQPKPSTGAHRHSALRAAAWAWVLALTLAACGPRVNVTQLVTEVDLGKAYLAQVQRTVLRVEVMVRDADGQPVTGLQVTAQVLDAAGREVANLTCEPESDTPGRYTTRPFALGAASLGSWEVNVTTRRGAASVLSAWTFQVGDQQVQALPTAELAGELEPGAVPVATPEPEALLPQSGSSTTVTAPAAPVVDRSRNALLFGVLVFIATVVGFVGLWRIWRVEDPLAERMKEYGMDGSSAFEATEAPTSELKRLSPLRRLAAGLGMGPRLADRLTQADIPLTASEYSLLTIGLALFGLFLGMWRFGLLLGVVLALVLGYLPILYLGMAIGRRRRTFSQQLPDVLMLLVGGLRAGYGLNQAMQIVVEQLPAPASKEFGRVVNAVSLGMPITKALEELAERIQVDDLGLIVTAISVQHQVGGNLAETLDTIGETIRDRIRIQGEIAALTAEEQLSAIVLGGLPTVVALVLFLIQPNYMRPLFEPGWQRLLPVVAVVLQVLGFVVIRKIIAIEV